jgi:hypothetical protein
MKSIAVLNEVVPIPGTSPYPPATNGAWIPQAVEYVLHEKSLKVQGKASIVQARCKFMFVGVDTKPQPPVPVTGNEEVILDAKKTSLVIGGKGMLLAGDEKVGQFGNKLQVVTANLIKTQPA